MIFNFQFSKMMVTQKTPVLKTFCSDKVTWFRPVTLEQLLKLKSKHPQAKMVVGNSEVGR